MREVTRAACGTVARARRVVRYFCGWSFPAGAKQEYLDVYADSDLAAKETAVLVS